MPHFTYLIVGGGMTADAAIDGIREVDPSGSIGVICAESHPPIIAHPCPRGSGRASLWKVSGVRPKTKG